MSSERAQTTMVEEGGGDVAVRWEKFLPTSSVKVLLVESDHSTRQIIAALLRKCGYTVFAASDGVKAWETLKDKSHNIDLVLSEVELPSISGFSLLTMIMDHEACKSIPVIMMSSQDSINLVFKCMLKGAADFLVKPIRKNELRNLWQHVWRKNISNSQQRSTNEHHDEKIAKRKLDDCSRRHINCMPENQECSEKGSDAQSSCTRSDMEAESTYPQSNLDDKQRRNMDIPLKNDTIPQAGEKHIQSDCLMSMNDHEADDNTTSMSARVERSPLNGNCSFNEPTPKECTFQIIENVNKDAHSKEIVDLLGAIDNQPRRSDLKRNVITVSDASEGLLNEKEGKYGLRPTPFLELSLRRYQQGTCGKSENDESNSWKHSNSSAFSLYNSRPVLPTSSTFMNSGNECKEHWSTSIRNQTVPDSDNATNAPSCNDAAATNINEEDSISLGMEFGSRGGMAVHHSSQQAVPFSIPVRETTSDRFCEGYGTIPPPIYYPQAPHPLWNVVQSMWQQGMNPMKNHHEDEQSPKSKHEEDKVHGDEQRHASSVTVESGSSSFCIVSGSNLNIDGSGNLCDRSEGNVAAVNISDAHTLNRNIDDQFNHEANKPSDLHCPSQREAALNKFRLKRKERCFEKKVRYHSRKRLAEQRPRVKGQFVRQVLPQS